jgi:hypothetical protein
MKTLCETNGFRAGAVLVPKFVLNQGDWIVLRWPECQGSDSEAALYEVLCGVSHCEEFTLRSKVGVATPFGKWSGELFRGRHTVGELLAALPPEGRNRLELEIKGRHLWPESSVNHLPGTAKTLACLLLATLSAGIVVFNTSGLDPMGVQKVYGYLADHMKHGLGFIEIQFPGGSQNGSHPVRVRVFDAYKD